MRCSFIFCNGSLKDNCDITFFDFFPRAEYSLFVSTWYCNTSSQFCHLFYVILERKLWTWSRDNNLEGSKNPLYAKSRHFCRRFGSDTVIKTLWVPQEFVCEGLVNTYFLIYSRYSTDRKKLVGWLDHVR